MGNGPCSCQKVIAIYLRVCHNELIQISLCLHHDPSKLLLTPTSHQVHHPLQNIKLAQFMGRQWADEDCNNMARQQGCAECVCSVAANATSGAWQTVQSAHQSSAQEFQYRIHNMLYRWSHVQVHTLKAPSTCLLAMFSAASHIPCGRCAMLATRLSRALANSSEAAASALQRPRLAKTYNQNHNNGSKMLRPV